jgi:hypothetical protein
MNDLERVENIASDARHAKEQAELQAQTEAAAREDELAGLAARLHAYQAAVARRIKVTIRKKKRDDGSSRLLVAMSSTSPRLRRPYIEYRITVADGARGVFSVSRVPAKLRRATDAATRTIPFTFGLFKSFFTDVEFAKEEAIDHLGYKTDQEIVALLDESVIQYIKQQGKFAFELPDWYTNAGYVMGYLCGIVTILGFLYAASDAGWFRLLLWFPVVSFLAYLVYRVARLIWLPYLCVILFLVARDVAAYWFAHMQG